MFAHIIYNLFHHAAREREMPERRAVCQARISLGTAAAAAAVEMKMMQKLMFDSQNTVSCWANDFYSPRRNSMGMPIRATESDAHELRDDCFLIGITAAAADRDR